MVVWIVWYTHTHIVNVYSQYIICITKTRRLVYVTVLMYIDKGAYIHTLDENDEIWRVRMCNCV